MAVILLTGYDVWGNRSINPSWEMLKDTQFELPPGWEVRVLKLPVAWNEVWPSLLEHLNDEVKAVVCFGLSEARRAIALEQMAYNLVDSRQPDARGILPKSDFACAVGPASYPTGLPLRALDGALTAEGIPVVHSEDAGRYLCNFIFYELMYWVEKVRPDVLGGFVHVPPLSESLDQGLPLATLRHAAQVIARTVADAATPVRSVKPNKSGPCLGLAGH